VNFLSTPISALPPALAVRLPCARERHPRWRARKQHRLLQPVQTLLQKLALLLDLRHLCLRHARAIRQRLHLRKRGFELRLRDAHVKLLADRLRLRIG
jgi:hypothetical protein